MTDMRTIATVEYGSASAARVTLNRDICERLSERYIAFDTETTGLDPAKDRIVELGAVLFENGVAVQSFQSYVNSGICISLEVSALNHITNEAQLAAPLEEMVYPEFLKFLGDAASGKTIVCGHVAAFDLSFLCRTLNRLGMSAHFLFVDTRELATQIPELSHHGLAEVAEYFQVPHEHAHHAKEDALTSGRVLRKMLENYRNK